MKTVVVYGQNHKGSTYHIAHALAKKIGGDLTEFFLPHDFGAFCTGCITCFGQSQAQCPHAKQLLPITKALDAADVIILASPVYVFHATGAMKAFLDHYGCRWMVHRPEASMFRKQGVVISTAAGMGMKPTNKDMADSLFFWGIARIYRLGFAVRAVSWEQISEKLRRTIDRKTTALAEKIVRRNGHIQPALKTKALFFAMHFLQRKGFNSHDAEYWKEKGWTGAVRPWK